MTPSWRWRLRSSGQDPPAYLRKAVLNAVRDNYRHLRVERRHPPLPSLPSAPAEVDETWAAPQALPGRYRDALVLRYYADLRVVDVAEVLRCPAGDGQVLGPPRSGKAKGGTW